jgi:hypothetical protein
VFRECSDDINAFFASASNLLRKQRCRSSGPTRQGSGANAGASMSKGVSSRRCATNVVETLKRKPYVPDLGRCLSCGMGLWLVCISRCWGAYSPAPNRRPHFCDRPLRAGYKRQGLRWPAWGTYGCHITKLRFWAASLPYRLSVLPNAAMLTSIRILGPVQLTAVIDNGESVKGNLHDDLRCERIHRAGVIEKSVTSAAHAVRETVYDSTNDQEEGKWSPKEERSPA